MPVQNRRGFLTAGTWCVDYNRMITHWPDEEGYAQVVGSERHGGGSGCNFALAIKHLDRDMHVETATLVGEDDDGLFLRRLATEMR